MKVYEQMVRFVYNKFVIRCWVPAYTSVGLSDLETKELVRNCLTILGNLEQEYPLQLAECICDKFHMNACEVTEKETGCGGVFYREWP